MKNTVMERIQKHQRVYENYGEPVPPYRITCVEHKELLTYLFPLASEYVKEQSARRIASYISVDLELVTTVEDYC